MGKTQCHNTSGKSINTYRICLRVFNSCSSQEWSCWLLEYGERLIWSLTSSWLQTRAPMHHMSLLGPEPSSSSSGCSAASRPAVEVHGCWSWSVLEISQDFKTENDKIHKCGSSYSTFYVYGTLRIHMSFFLLKERKNTDTLMTQNWPIMKNC